MRLGCPLVLDHSMFEASDTLARQRLQRPWFPAELEIRRAEVLVWIPADFRKHGVHLSRARTAA